MSSARSRCVGVRSLIIRLIPSQWPGFDCRPKRRCSACLDATSSITLIAIFLRCYQATLEVRQALHWAIRWVPRCSRRSCPVQRAGHGYCCEPGVTFLVEVKSLAFDDKDKNPSAIKSFLPPEQTHALYTLAQAQAERQGEEVLLASKNALGAARLHASTMRANLVSGDSASASICGFAKRRELSSGSTHPNRCTPVDLS